MRFRLRTLLVLVTVLCFGFAYYAYSLGQRGKYGEGSTCGIGLSDPQVIAKAVRERIGALPDHKLVEEEPFDVMRMPPPLFTAQRDVLQRDEVSDQAFYEVTLSDGSLTHVGFWVHGRSDVTYAIYAHDSYLSGPADERRKERRQLQHTYDEILRQLSHETRYGDSPRAWPTSQKVRTARGH